MLVFAYDGSLNGDWVAHYAVRFAANTSARRLRLLHVLGAVPEAQLAERIARIGDESRVLGVDLESELVPGRGSVAARLLELVPGGATVVMGTRARPRRGALLAGTVAADLLATGRCGVIALRVVHPGVLGQPGSVLLPLTERPRSAAQALPLLRLLGDDLGQLHVLLVRGVSRLRLRVLGEEAAGQRLDQGRVVLEAIEAELRHGLARPSCELDSTVVLSDDIAREILLHAGKHRSRLLCLAASKRSLPQRLLRGDLIERVLRETASDVAVYGSLT